MREFEELSEVEKALRSLIYAVESKDIPNPKHPFPLGEQYLSITLVDVKKIAKNLNIPLVKIEKL